MNVQSLKNSSLCKTIICLDKADTGSMKVFNRRFNVTADTTGRK